MTPPTAPSPQLSSCETSAPYYTSALPCSGHGTCVNLSDSRVACVCDSGWSGASDIFDLRVGIEPLTGAMISLDCGQSAAGVVACWGFMLLFALFRTFENSRALREVFARKRPARLTQLVTQVRYRCLIMELCTVTPLMIASGVMKIATAFSASPLVLGTDASITVIFTLGVFSGLVTVSDFLTHQFEVLVKAQIDHASTRARVISLSRRLALLTLGSYLILSVVPAWVALGLDKSLGPIKNGEFIIIIVRNLGIVAWQVFQLSGSWYLLRETRALKSFLMSPLPSPREGGASGPGSDELTSPSSPKTSAFPSGGGPSKDKMASIILMMEERSNDLVKTNVSVGLFYVVLTIPQLFAFQTYPYSVFSALGLVTSPGRSMHSIFSASNRGELSPPSSSSKKAKSPRHVHANEDPDDARQDNTPLQENSDLTFHEEDNTAVEDNKPRRGKPGKLSVQSTTDSTHGGSLTMTSMLM